MDSYILAMHYTPSFHGFMDHEKCIPRPLFMDLWILTMHYTPPFHRFMDHDHAYPEPLFMDLLDLDAEVYQRVDLDTSVVRTSRPGYGSGTNRSVWIEKIHQRVDLVTGVARTGRPGYMSGTNRSA